MSNLFDFPLTDIKYVTSKYTYIDIILYLKVSKSIFKPTEGSFSVHIFLTYRSRQIVQPEQLGIIYIYKSLLCRKMIQPF